MRIRRNMIGQLFMNGHVEIIDLDEEYVSRLANEFPIAHFFFISVTTEV